MHILWIDTSDENSFIALDHEIFYFDTKSRQSLELFPALEALLKKCQITLKDLTHIAIGIGPGSFTGTRLGIATAKSLGYALNIPVLSFCSLMKYAPTQLGPFLIQTDAKSKGFYQLEGVLTSDSLHYSPSFEPSKTPSNKPLVPLSPVQLPHLQALFPLLRSEKALLLQPIY